MQPPGCGGEAEGPSLLSDLAVIRLLAYQPAWNGSVCGMAKYLLAVVMRTIEGLRRIWVRF
jgi:hypothetical protein